LTDRQAGGTPDCQANHGGSRLSPDGIAPGLDFIMVSVPEGIAAGYSGSPVYVNGKLVGAVSYGLPSDDSAVGGLTPAGPMLDVLGYPDANASLARAASTTKRVQLTPRLRLAAAQASGAPLATVPQNARHLPVALAVSGLDDRGMCGRPAGVRQIGPARRDRGRQGDPDPAPVGARRHSTAVC
jgi:hypothetical protein